MQTPIHQKRLNFRIPYFRPSKCPLHSAARGACPLSPPFPPSLTRLFCGCIRIIWCLGCSLRVIDCVALVVYREVFVSWVTHWFSFQTIVINVIVTRVVDTCSLTKFEGVLKLLHEADDDAVTWLRINSDRSIHEIKWNETIKRPRIYVFIYLFTCRADSVTRF